MIWGRQDPHVPLDGRKRTLAALEDAGVNFSWHEFNGQHAFMRDEGPRYDGELAMHCYALCVALFRRKLGAGDLPVPGGYAAGEQRRDFVHVDDVVAGARERPCGARSRRAQRG
jgi:carboxymethylenebutenolidase